MLENPYVGINAHLNSLLQTPSTDDQPAIWHSFHTHHIMNIVEALNTQLSDRYVAMGEQSLQTRELETGGTIVVRHPRPNVSIFQHKTTGIQMPVAAIEAPTWEAELVDVIDPVKHPTAAIIREAHHQGKLGRIVTRIELLSPANKPQGRHYDTYVQKRADAIQTNVPLIEIDYLHESAPTIDQHPIYPQQRGSYPYLIAVSDTRPEWHLGKISVYGFGLSSTIPKFPVPLAESERLAFDLNAVYQHTFRAGRWGDLLDYADEPERFETYSRQDQNHIRAIMLKASPASS